MGCGVGDPPTAKTINIKKIYDGSKTFKAILQQKYMQM